MGIIDYLPHPWSYVALVAVFVTIAAICLRQFIAQRRARVRGVDPWIILVIGILFALIALTRDSGDPPPHQPDLYIQDVERSPD